MPPFRVFGSPYTLALHQHVTYLRLKQLPFKVYCTSFTTTLLYSFYYKARNAFCTVTPSGESVLQLWQLVEMAELDENLKEVVANSAHVSDVQYNQPSQGDTATRRGAADDSRPTTDDDNPQSPLPASPAGTPGTQRILVNKNTHPQLHLAQWVTVVYACWWLTKEGAMYRWVLGDSLDIVEAYVRYFFFTVGGVGPARTIAPKFRQAMQRLTAVMGISKDTAPFMDEHFRRMCDALEQHFQQHPDFLFVLGTPHPTLADVTLGSAFSAFFLMDDPPASTISELYPHVLDYAERVTGWRGAVLTDPTPPTAASTTGRESASTQAPPSSSKASVDQSPHATSDYPDTVPESLAPFFEVVTEVFPFLMSQCAAFNAYMSGDAVQQLKREPLEGKWKGCHGYLFPQLTNIKSLMIIDNSVLTVQARAQDLEVALMAAREVADSTLSSFGRSLEEPSNAADPANTSEASARARVCVAPSTHDNAAVVSSQPAPPAASSVAASFEEALEGDHDLRTSAEPTSRLDLPTADRWRKEPLRAGELEADAADYYRAFTRGGYRHLAGTTQDRGVIAPPYRGPGQREGLVATPEVSVLDRLEALRRMLCKMQSPQYTLTSLYLGRRMFVAAIPEYEVEKIRRAQQAPPK